MGHLAHPLRFVLFVLAAWFNQHQEDVIDISPKRTVVGRQNSICLQNQ
jgi:hypothetical protein